MPEFKKECGNCSHWISWDQEYDDPLEPDDYGTCKLEHEPTSEDDTCSKFKLSLQLEYLQD